MRILIYGAGVIGSLYGALLSAADLDVTLYARGRRLETLRKSGLRYRTKDGVKRASVNVIDMLAPTDRYDFVFLTVKENQLYTALQELKENISPTIVTMVNSLDSYDRWEAICGEGRILPAFPGAGGGFDGEVLDAALTPRLIQPTTIGRIDERANQLAALFKKAHIPYVIVEDMHAWQICHLAMVVPIADAYHEADDPKNAGKDRTLMGKTARNIRDNLKAVASRGIPITPKKLNLFRVLPAGLVRTALGFTFRSRFGEVFMYRHSVKAPDEMRRLHEQFYSWLEGNET
ncbi:MAG: ketopantoate reductase family protein [Oscillospiraceae bacterium]|nr:ketopantoate reductase family protein [Oscillospiraceae bacterium]